MFAIIEDYPIYDLNDAIVGQVRRRASEMIYHTPMLAWAMAGRFWAEADRNGDEYGYSVVNLDTGLRWFPTAGTGDDTC